MVPWFDEYLAQHAEDSLALRLCLRLKDEKSAAYLMGCADALTREEAYNPACAIALFYAWEQTGDEKYALAIRRSMQALEMQADVGGDALAFRMAYEMQLNRMEKVGQTAAMFRAAHLRLAGAALEEKAAFLLALTDAIAVCSDQLYEHWRALVDLYRAMVADVLPALADASPQTMAMLLWALISGVEMGLIDPERYLPVVRRHTAVLRQLDACAAAALEEGFGVK